MATPPSYAPPRQDMPPPGGFQPPPARAKMPISRGPPGWAAFLGVFVMTSYGFYKVGQAHKHHRAVERDERERKIAMLPFLQAEADVQFLRAHERVMAQEREVMRDVPGWPVGTRHYHSKRYTVPLYAQRK